VDSSTLHNELIRLCLTFEVFPFHEQLSTKKKCESDAHVMVCFRAMSTVIVTIVVAVILN